MCKEKSHMAQFLTAVSLWNNMRIGIWDHKRLHLSSTYPWHVPIKLENPSYLRILTNLQQGFCGHCICETLLNARYERVSETSRHSYIHISDTKHILEKQRLLANTRLVGLQWSPGSSIGKNTRSATPRALTWSYAYAGTTQINKNEARSLARQLQQKWRSNSI